jgi:hypothetical protein
MNEITRITKLAGLNESIDNFELSAEEMDKMDAADIEKWHTALPVLDKQIDDWMQKLIDSYPDMVQVDDDEFDRLMVPLGQKLENYGRRIKTGNL